MCYYNIFSLTEYDCFMMRLLLKCTSPFASQIFHIIQWQCCHGVGQKEEITRMRRRRNVWEKRTVFLWFKCHLHLAPSIPSIKISQSQFIISRNSLLRGSPAQWGKCQFDQVCWRRETPESSQSWLLFEDFLDILQNCQVSEKEVKMEKN